MDVLIYEVVRGSIWIVLVQFLEILIDLDFNDEIQLKWGRILTSVFHLVISKYNLYIIMNNYIIKD